MDVKPHPTSPKYKAEPGVTVAKVWNDQKFDRPRRTPWLSLILVMIVLNVLITAGLVVGWGWLERNAPQTRWLQWLPLQTSTTVVQQTTVAPSVDLPSAVKSQLTGFVALAHDQGVQSLYTEPNVIGLALPLSSTGWMVALKEEGADTHTVGLMVATGTTTSVQLLPDPASPFTFLKLDQLSLPPVDLVTDAPTPGQRVWVMTGPVSAPSAVSRTLVQSSGPAWQSADTLQNFWELDAPVVSHLGAPVMDTSGRIVGMLGANSRVWSVETIGPVVSGVIQHGHIDRPQFGFQYVMTSGLLASDQTLPAGAIIGAATGDQAIVPKGPADKAGMKAGDIITTVDQHALQTDLAKVLRTYHPGDQLKLTVQRAGKTLQFTLTVGSLQP